MTNLRHSKKFPNFLRPFFWEVDFAKLDVKKHQIYIIERLLEYGNVQAYRWLKGNFTKETLKNIALGSRKVDVKTKNFWKIIP